VKLRIWSVFIVLAVSAVLLLLAHWPGTERTEIPEDSPPAPGTDIGAMVEVPAGPFWMGCHEAIDNNCLPDEKPFRQVDLPAFAVDKYEVTVGEYRRCVEAGVCAAPVRLAECNYWLSGRDNYPVNCLGVPDGRDYCAWAGKQMPTEEQWEKAARGVDGRLFPWGNEFNPAYANRGDGGEVDGFVTSAPVGSFPEGASPYGAMDMIGNCWEWTITEKMTHYDPAIPTAISDDINLVANIAKGGGDEVDQVWPLRLSARAWSKPVRHTPLFGFRCVKPLE